jgi:exopolysaccharide biosynthesis protein
MTSATTLRRRALVLGTAGAIVAGIGLTAPQGAVAVDPCKVDIKNVTLDSTQRFAGGSKLKRYGVSVDYPVGTTYDQTAKVVLGVYPANAYPTLLNAKIGNRTKTGDMVKAQEPQAVAAINGDFFLTPTIRGNTFEIARGPMVKNGRIIRADRNRQRVVGVDTTLKPFGGWFGVRGNIQSGVAPAVDIEGINWHKIQGGGVTIYTTDWNAGSSTPRPAGTAEWVINGRNLIKEVRTSTKNAGKLGDPVAAGTRVIAFSENTALAAVSGTVNAKVKVNIRHSTDSGVKLQTAVGRGLPLVENGVAAPLGCAEYDHSKAARPRTTVGWTATGQWRSFTVPGKLFTGPGLRSGGFGLANEANIAKRLGLVYAYELDGGGSTTLYTRSGGGKWKRRDLYGLDTSTGTYEREVPTGLAFVVP